MKKVTNYLDLILLGNPDSILIGIDFYHTLSKGIKTAIVKNYSILKKWNRDTYYLEKKPDA